MGTTETQKWGRVLICGGTDWTKLGRKERGGKTDVEPVSPDLLSPHILRSLSNIRVTSAHTSSSSCHFVILDVDGHAWLFGRNGSSALGTPKVDQISENAPRKVTVQSLSGREGKFVHAATGRNHTLLVTDEGEVWTAGNNALGQCGHSPCPEVTLFTLIPPSSFGNEQPVQAAAGVTFSLILTASGRVFSFGSAEKGQLGNGFTGERIMTGNKTVFDVEYEPILIRELDGKRITQVACGQQHAIAIDDTGLVYVWGYNGYCRLGLGDQKDVLKPKAVPHFAEKNEATRAAFVTAGPSSSVVVDKQGMFWMAGKWKNTGEGSSGSPYTTFRVMQDIMACKVLNASCGGVTHWIVTPDDEAADGVMTVCWGQNAANGELGMGEEAPKSATKAGKNIPLNGIDVLSVAAGQNTTVIIARPSTSVEEKWNDQARHPEELEGVAETCLVCHKEKPDDVEVLECEKCESPFHLECLSPPLSSVPEGEWFCQYCMLEPGAAIQGYEVDYKKLLQLKPSAKKDGADDIGGKRKAGVVGGAAASKKKKQ